MSQTLSLSCRCGALRGALHGASPARGQRMRCYCRDCQSYAHHLGQAELTLDAQGGSGLFQTTPGGLEISTGRNNLACLRLGPKGPLRWYASCCNTPLANTLAQARLPFVALLDSVWGDNAQALLGSKELGVHARFAKGGNAAVDAHPAVPARILAGVAARLIKARLHGEHRRSPFFDQATGAPVCAPYVLSREEREEALARC